MDTLEFTKAIEPKEMANIFKNYFEQHMAAYYMLKGLDFVSITVSGVDKASILYSVKLLNPDQITRICDIMNNQSANLRVYNSVIKPKVFANGDLLCITLEKDNNTQT